MFVSWPWDRRLSRARDTCHGRVTMEPPACLLHVWLGDGQGLVTHVSQIEAHPLRIVVAREDA